MADLEYTVRADTSSATASLTRMRNVVADVTTAFGRLTGVIAGLGLTAAVANAVAYADAIQDLSDSTGIAISNIQGFSKAVTLNGGSAELAQKSILRLVSSIDAAAGGSVAALKAFGELGVTFQDLNRLSEQDILAKTILGLANIRDASERAGKAQQLLGREARNINWDGVAGSIARATEEARKNEAAIKSAAAAQNSIDIATMKVKDSLLQAIKPLADFIAALKPEQINNFVEATVKIGAALTAIAASMGVLKILAASIAAVGSYALLAKAGLASLAVGFAGIVTAASLLKDVFLVMISGFVTAGARLTVLKDLFAMVGRAILAILAGVSRLIPIVALVTTGLYAAHVALKNLFDIDLVKKFGDAWSYVVDKINKLRGVQSPTFLSSEEVDNENARLAARSRAAQMAQDEAAARNRMAQIEKEIAGSAQKANLALSQRIQAVQDEYGTRLDSVALEREALDLNDQQAAGLRARVEQENKLYEAIRRVKDEIAKTELDVKFIDPNDVKALSEAQYKLALLRQEQVVLSDLLKRQPAELQRAVESLERARFLKEKEKEATQMLLEAQEEYNQALSEQLGRQIEAQNRAFAITNDLVKQNQLKETQAELEAAIRNLRGEDQATIKEIFDLEQKRKNLLEEIANIPDLTAEARLQQEQRVNAEIDRSRAYIEQRAATTKAEQDNFGLGWANAFERWRNNLQTDAEYAGQIFSTFTRGFEDAFVRMVSTGKLSFKDLANSILADVTRMAANRLLLSLFGMAGGSAGGSILSSIGSFFGGFFAKGGTLGAGKWGIAGESGPEIISGPANITPMTAAPTMVTYNIQAVDASSFRALVARDPEFIFNVTEQGRRSMPTRSRR